MKRYIFLLIFITCWVTMQAQKKLSVLGDSYSTFKGYVQPDTNLVWYPEGKGNDVALYEETWIPKLLKITDLILEKNNSYSGSTICNTGYSKQDYSDRSFITRVDNLGNPDVILVFGGTNDDWAKSPLGEFKYKNFSKLDLYSFRPALAFLCAKLKKSYPKAKVFFVLNTDLKPDINASFETILKHYKMPLVKLHDIDKTHSHPSKTGMTAIATQIAEVILGFVHR